MFDKKYIFELKSKRKELKKRKIKSLLHFDINHYGIFKNRIKSINTIIKLSKHKPDEKYKIAVYTAVYGNYDTIKPIKFKSSNCDYYIFSDCNVDDNLGWTKKGCRFPKNVTNNTLKNRYLKMNPHLFFSNYDYSIYIDATLVINYDISLLINRLDKKFIGMFSHEETRNCIYDEAKAVIKAGRAPKEIVEDQMSRYAKEGFPKNFGLTENNIIVRKHNDHACIELMELWWNEFIFDKNSKRDQLCFMYSLWKLGHTINDVALLGYGYYDDPMFTAKDHNK